MDVDCLVHNLLDMDVDHLSHNPAECWFNVFEVCSTILRPCVHLSLKVAVSECKTSIKSLFPLLNAWEMHAVEL